MFPIEAIVLKKHRIHNNKIVITCFSREYGKIDIFHTERWNMVHLDTLSFFTGQIRTKEHNTLVNIYRVIGFLPLGNYDLYDLSGWLVSILYQLLPHGLAYPRLFQILKNITVQHETCHHDILLFLIQTCCDFGIVRCNIDDYKHILQSDEGQKQVKYEIEGWIKSYIISL